MNRNYMIFTTVRSSVSPVVFPGSASVLPPAPGVPLIPEPLDYLVGCLPLGQLLTLTGTSLGKFTLERVIY